MMVPAGGMTATARADIGARFEARPKSVGLRIETETLRHILRVFSLHGFISMYMTESAERLSIRAQGL